MAESVASSRNYDDGCGGVKLHLAVAGPALVEASVSSPSAGAFLPVSVLEAEATLTLPAFLVLESPLAPTAVGQVGEWRQLFSRMKG